MGKKKATAGGEFRCATAGGNVTGRTFVYKQCAPCLRTWYCSGMCQRRVWHCPHLAAAELAQHPYRVWKSGRQNGACWKERR